MENTWALIQLREWDNKTQVIQILTEDKTTVADMGDKRQNDNNLESTAENMDCDRHISVQIHLVSVLLF